MAKIGITGSQSCGKTTLLNDLAELEIFKGYTICNEVTRSLAAKGFTINEGGNDATQRAIMDVHNDNLQHSDMLTDRTAIDGLVYTIWLWKQGNVTTSTVQVISHVADALIPDYDIIFYVKPEFDIEDDGVRSASVTFRDEIATLFEEVIAKKNLQLVPLTGSREERVQQVLTAVKDKQQ